ncbi:hypothetical protein NQ318_004459 [Aromia moschata]|uniref:Uncharacterized protein n=1 Tax=Aromia moschata TaxID=1265417 RepID=A0AAV8YC52_9CUCU|nr:hypothetical protein NQ318_004459 [Aromia moschata]
MVPKLLTPEQKEWNICDDILNNIDTDPRLLDTVTLTGTRLESVEAVKAKTTEPADRSGLPALLSTMEKSYGAMSPIENVVPELVEVRVTPQDDIALRNKQDRSRDLFGVQLEVTSLLLEAERRKLTVLQRELQIALEEGGSIKAKEHQKQELLVAIARIQAQHDHLEKEYREHALGALLSANTRGSGKAAFGFLDGTDTTDSTPTETEEILLNFPDYATVDDAIVTSNTRTIDGSEREESDSEEGDDHSPTPTVSAGLQNVGELRKVISTPENAEDMLIYINRINNFLSTHAIKNLKQSTLDMFLSGHSWCSYNKPHYKDKCRRTFSPSSPGRQPSALRIHVDCFARSVSDASGTKQTEKKIRIRATAPHGPTCSPILFAYRTAATPRAAKRRLGEPSKAGSQPQHYNVVCTQSGVAARRQEFIYEIVAVRRAKKCVDSRTSRTKGHAASNRYEIRTDRSRSRARNLKLSRVYPGKCVARPSNSLSAMQEASRAGDRPKIAPKPAIASKPKYVPPVKLQQRLARDENVNIPRRSNVAATKEPPHTREARGADNYFAETKQVGVETTVKYDEYLPSYVSEKCDKFSTSEPCKKVEDLPQKAPQSPSTVCCSILSNATTDCCGIINVNKKELNGKSMAKIDSVDSNSSDSGGFKDFVQLDLTKKPSPDADKKPELHQTHQRKVSQPEYLDKKLIDTKPPGHQRKSSQPDYMSQEVRQSFAQNKQNFVANAQALAQFLPQTEQKILQHKQQAMDRNEADFRQQLAKFAQTPNQKTEEPRAKPSKIIAHGQFQQSTKKLEELLSQRLEKEKLMRKGQNCLLDGESSQDVEQKMMIQKQIQQKLQADLQQTVKQIQEIQSIELRLPQNRKWGWFRKIEMKVLKNIQSGADRLLGSLD